MTAPESPVAPAPSHALRFASLDSLRGLTALGVALFHFYGGAGLNTALKPAVPDFLEVIILRWLPHGVEVFFLLSGFVMAFVVGSKRMTFPGAGNFLLRRVVRIGPPYWATIFVAIFFTAAANTLLPGRNTPLPDGGTILSNVFFAQMFTKHSHIVYIFWTLCIEMQFYLVFTAILLLWGALSRWPKAGSVLMHAGLLVLFWISLDLRLERAHHETRDPWFLCHWYAFAMGMVTYWIVQRRIPEWLFWLYTALLAFAFFVLEPSKEFFPMEALGLTLFGALVMRLVVERPALEKLLSHKVLLYFGTISYSLYLLHMVVGYRMAILMKRVDDSVLWYGVILAACFIGSIIGAHLLYLVVERPAMALSRRLKSAPLKPAEANVPASPLHVTPQSAPLPDAP